MNNITNNDEILRELAELKEKTIAVLDEIERVETEINAIREKVIEGINKAVIVYE